MAAKTSLTHCAIMLILLISVRMAQPIFFYQHMRNLYLGNYKKDGEKSLRMLTGDLKNEMVGPSGPPLYVLHVFPQGNNKYNQTVF